MILFTFSRVLGAMGLLLGLVWLILMLIVR